MQGPPVGRLADMVEAGGVEEAAEGITEAALAVGRPGIGPAQAGGALPAELDAAPGQGRDVHQPADGHPEIEPAPGREGQRLDAGLLSFGQDDTAHAGELPGIGSEMAREGRRFAHRQPAALGSRSMRAKASGGAPFSVMRRRISAASRPSTAASLRGASCPGSVARS